MTQRNIGKSEDEPVIVLSKFIHQILIKSYREIGLGNRHINMIEVIGFRSTDERNRLDK